MCGLAGFLSPLGVNESHARSHLEKMTSAIAHRGPDDAGIWLDGSLGIALGHRRLSIIDLTEAGRQPMMSQSGRYIIVFNGEIYNHPEIRKNLGNLEWRGHSDTETLLAAIERWGLAEALKLSVGMFAIALWDRELKTLSLARDRMGEKPLYYGWQGNTFLFGSELKAIRQHPEFIGEIDRNALALYVRRGYVPTPLSIFEGLHKLTPGTILRMTATFGIGSCAKPEPYWSVNDAVIGGAANRFDGGPIEAVEELENHLVSAIKRQQIADVPLGAFLSGGIDSSTVVALMQSVSTVPVKTFTIGFEEQEYNEATHARAVAQHLSTEHTELYVTARQAMNVIPDLRLIYDEPFADASQIPTVLVSRLARKQVTVALSGDGGDEVFGGYDRYQQAVSMWNRLSILPSPLRTVFTQAIQLIPAALLNAAGDGLSALGLQSSRRAFGDQSRALAQALGCENVDAFYQLMISQWKGNRDLVIGADHTLVADRFPDALNDPKERMMFSDALNYLPDDILVKVDRAAMSTSLETRVPFLDHRVVEFAWRLPIQIKINDGAGKWPLKQILYKYVPQEMVNRPKMGFGVPIDHWLRGPLRDWAEELLSEERLYRQGFFDPVPIRNSWKQHLSGFYDRHFQLWTILMFQAWLEN